MLRRVTIVVFLTGTLMLVNDNVFADDRAWLDDPRSSRSDHDVSVDVNGDGNPDLVFKQHALIKCIFGLREQVKHWWRLTVYPMDGLEVPMPGDFGVQPFEYGDKIGPDVWWTRSGVELLELRKKQAGWDPKWRGSFANTPEPILGVRMKVEDLYYYGWIRVACDAETGKIAAHDWAFLDEPGVPIAAGRRARAPEPVDEFGVVPRR